MTVAPSANWIDVAHIHNNSTTAISMVTQIRRIQVFFSIMGNAREKSTVEFSTVDRRISCSADTTIKVPATVTKRAGWQRFVVLAALADLTAPMQAVGRTGLVARTVYARCMSVGLAPTYNG
jgi:hypothetical protein